MYFYIINILKALKITKKFHLFNILIENLLLLLIFSSQHLSFSFTFFVHGDTVCASIDLREHPAVRPLSKEHLTEAAAAFAAAGNSQTLSQSHEHGNATNLPEDVASPHNPNNGGAVGEGATNSNSSNSSSSPKPRRVILAPFGMAATLTGNSFKATDPMAEKILEDWASFFPLCNKENSDVPPVVEVVSGKLIQNFLHIIQ